MSPWRHVHSLECLLYYDNQGPYCLQNDWVFIFSSIYHNTITMSIQCCKFDIFQTTRYPIGNWYNLVSRMLSEMYKHYPVIVYTSTLCIVWNDNNNKPFFNLSYLIGWNTDCLVKDASDVLEQTRMPLFSQGRCRMMYTELTENMVCGGYTFGGTDACKVWLASNMCIFKSIFIWQIVLLKRLLFTLITK